MTRASFTAPGANRSITFSDGKGRKNFCINKENGKIFSFSFHFPLIFLKKSSKTATNPRYLVPSLHQSDCHLSLAFQAGNEAHSACSYFL